MTIKDTILPKNDQPEDTTGALYRRRFPENDSVTELSVAVRPVDYSASVMARAVEDCDANLLNLNVTSERTDDGDLIVDIRVDHLNGEAVARALERYGFEVLSFDSPGMPGYDKARERADEILRILDI